MAASADSMQNLNSLPASAAEQEFLHCCGSHNWAQRLVDERAHRSASDLVETANRVWWSLAPDDWLEAFRSHPKIGEQKAAAVTAVEAQKWSADEQSGIK